jgi:hypothetical protein
MLELSLHIDAAVMVSNTLSNGLFQRLSGSGSCSSKGCFERCQKAPRDGEGSVRTENSANLPDA